MRPIAALFAVAFAILAAAPGRADETYPQRPITMVVPFPPGGVADVSARPVAAALERILGQPVVVLNKGGAGGAIGTASVATAKPDGYTLLMGLASISTLPEADRLFARPAAFELKQLVPLARVTADPTLLVVAGDSPYRTLQDVVDAARQRPGAIPYASSGNYGTYHIATEMFTAAAGIKMSHVPYNGGGPALRAILSKEVELGLLGPSVAAGNIAAGKLRALAAWSAARLPQLPEVPTLKELGYDVEYYIWSGVFAPSGTPAPVVARLRDALKQAITGEAVGSALAGAGSPVAYLDAPEFGTFFEADAARLGAVVRRIGRID
ncbi:tripartite tricarboxylate transporter substrate binding protein [Vineibacter terrae]|uniref:Tripartite tricarboxylate transporter substrate binding protein n=1 Tax=Vineibacter terrae TaxID=2586908 RepID=A0A5C8PBH5_9HYPH|nr:tripartite tricarboxylate transporter substrate binding protein [Vineibacter terrae]TXL71046.1 tripartite tricarboxylate transporter substrate binding protein [Vineibacter terrae]